MLTRFAPASHHASPVRIASESTGLPSVLGLALLASASPASVSADVPLDTELVASTKIGFGQPRWSYQYNLNGHIGNESSYVSLTYINESKKYETDTPAYDFLFVNRTHAHPGGTESQNIERGIEGPNQFAIIGFQVPELGEYFLANVSVEMTQFHMNESGVDFRVYSVNEERFARNPYEENGGYITSAFTAMWIPIGQMAAEEELYVAFGPGKSDAYDTLEYSFNVMKAVATTTTNTTSSSTPDTITTEPEIPATSSLDTTTARSSSTSATFTTSAASVSSTDSHIAVIVAVAGTAAVVMVVVWRRRCHQHGDRRNATHGSSTHVYINNGFGGNGVGVSTTKQLPSMSRKAAEEAPAERCLKCKLRLQWCNCDVTGGIYDIRNRSGAPMHSLGHRGQGPSPASAFYTEIDEGNSHTDYNTLKGAQVDPVADGMYNTLQGVRINANDADHPSVGASVGSEGVSR